MSQVSVTDLINNAALEFGSFTLPSNGKIIKIRPTRTVEEKFLKTLSRESPNLEEKLCRYITSITNLKELEMDPLDLTSGDQLALLIYSRIISKDSNMYSVSGKCPGCDRVYREEVDLSKLEVKKLPDVFTEPILCEWEPHQLKIYFRLVRVRDEVELRNWHNDMDKSGLIRDLPGADDDAEGLYARTITRIEKNGEEVNLLFSDKRELLLQIDAVSYEQLVNKHDSFYHGFDLRFDYVCPICMYKNKIAFELGRDFFFQTTTQKG